MSLSIYDASIPPMLHALGTLSAVLDKASAHCEKEKIDPTVLLTARLFPDMFTLTRQVQVVSDTAKGGAARLAGVEAPKFADTEASFADLKARLEALPAGCQDAELIQTEVYEAGKAAGFEPLRGWFQALYEVLLGQSQGPRFGSFAAIFGLENTIALIEQALA